MEIWFNDSLSKELALAPTGGGWLIGDGAFESIRTYSGRAFALDRHIDRLEGTLSKLSITAISRELIREGVEQTIRANPHHPFGRLRITVFGDGNWMVTHIGYIPENRGMKLALSELTRDSADFLSGIKSISYQINSVALKRAAVRGFDDLIFLNQRGEVMESALANLIWLKDGSWHTPSLITGCLPGVARAFLVENFGVKESLIREEELEQVEALALTSSLREISPVERFESHLYGNSKSLLELTEAFHYWILGNLEQ